MSEAALQRIQAGLAAANTALLQGELEVLHRQLADTLDALAEVTRAGLVPRQQRDANPWDVAQATALVWDLLARLRLAGCRVFPYAGTLLGLQRDGRVLPNDKDADLGVWLEDFALAGRVLQQFGLGQARDVPPFDNVATFIDPGSRCTVDLFGLHRNPVEGRIEGGAWLHGRPPSHQRLLLLPWFTLVERAGPSGPVWWPHAPDRLLEACYGSDWRTPQPDWDSLVSNPALAHLNLSWQCYALKALVQKWLTGDLVRTRRLLEQIAARAGDDDRLRRWREALR